MLTKIAVNTRRGVLITMLRFLILILFSVVSAEVFGDGPCPEVKSIENFDFNAVGISLRHRIYSVLDDQRQFFYNI